MKPFCICIYLLAAMLLCPVALAKAASAEERIINLPNDNGKWWISIVGNPGNPVYDRVAGWFNTDLQLKSLKDQVRFCVVHGGTPIFNARYRDNVAGLPTIRMQEADGRVVYEAWGSRIPKTSDMLYLEISTKVCELTRPFLPWRREIERRCPERQPDNASPVAPAPVPDLDPEPQPIDDGGPPKVDQSSVMSNALILLLLVACAIAGAAAGVVIQWKKTYSKESGLR